jgi:hypothetical protein
VDFPCTYLHTCILTLKYVQTYLPTCKVPYTVSTGLARQGLRDDTMESREKSGTHLARSCSETDLYKRGKQQGLADPGTTNQPDGASTAA